MHALCTIYLSDEDQKKLLRRQRNKEAAARCRKRRYDQTISLEEEVSQWEAKNLDIQNTIKTLEAQKLDLENLLKNHQEKCNANIGSKSKIVINETLIKTEKDKDSSEKS